MRYLFSLLFLTLFLTASDYEKSINAVIDTKNNLMWQDNEEVTHYLETSITAKVYCESIVLNGYIDWRVPTIDELVKIIDATQKNAIRKEFRFLKPNFYSTSSSFKRNRNFLWGVDFKSGKIMTDKKENKNYIRCVRDMI